MDLRIPIIASTAIFLVLIFMYIGPSFGFSATATVDFISLIPTLIFLVAGLYMVVRLGGVFLFPALSIIGFGLALLLKALDEAGYLTVAMKSGLSTPQLMFLTVVIAAMFGGLAAAFTAKR